MHSHLPRYSQTYRKKTLMFMCFMFAQCCLFFFCDKILPLIVFLHPFQMFFTLFRVTESFCTSALTTFIIQYLVQMNSPAPSILSFVPPHLPFDHAIYFFVPSCSYPSVLDSSFFLTCLMHFQFNTLPFALYLSLGSVAASLSSTHTHFIPLPCFLKCYKSPQSLILDHFVSLLMSVTLFVMNFPCYIAGREKVEL